MKKPVVIEDELKPVIIVEARLKEKFERLCKEAVEKGYWLESTKCVYDPEDNIFPKTQFIAIFILPKIKFD